MEYTIGEISRMLGINSSTLRYYEKEGLLPNVNRTGSGIRKYGEQELVRLRIIDCLKKTGMPLKDIRNFIEMTQQGDSTIDARLALFEKQRRNVEQQIEQLKSTLEIIDYKYWYYQTAKEKGTTDFVENMPESEIPADKLETHRYLHKAGI